MFNMQKICETITPGLLGISDTSQLTGDCTYYNFIISFMMNVFGWQFIIYYFTLSTDTCTRQGESAATHKVVHFHIKYFHVKLTFSVCREY